MSPALEISNNPQIYRIIAYLTAENVDKNFAKKFLQIQSVWHNQFGKEHFR